MAKFISIATPVANYPQVVVNADQTTATSATSTTVLIYIGAKTMTITVGAGEGPTLLAAVNTALLGVAGPTCVPVVIPSSVTISAIAVA